MNKHVLIVVLLRFPGALIHVCYALLFVNVELLCFIPIIKSSVKHFECLFSHIFQHTPTHSHTKVQTAIHTNIPTHIRYQV